MIVMNPAYVHINHKQLDDLVIQKKSSKKKTYTLSAVMEAGHIAQLKIIYWKRNNWH